MSRIGRKPIEIPKGVTVTVKDHDVTVKGPVGSLTRTFHDLVTITREGDTLLVTRANDEPQARALHGLSRALLANMVTGVEKGFEKKLEFTGVGWRANLQGRDLALSIGFSHPVNVKAPDGITFKVDTYSKPPYGSMPLITISGADKELVGQVAADIRGLRPPEPYLGKGIAYQGEHIRRKAGKTAK
jgi:large subunit ribosomal protein L6